MLRVVVITPPGPVLTWDEARAHLRLEADDDRQAFVMSLVAAATGHIDGPSGWLGRAIGVQTLELRLDDFAYGGVGVRYDLRLPFAPIKSITSVKYVSPAGTEQVFDPASTELLGDRLSLAYGFTWPTARYQSEAIRVRYVAGYDVVPAPITVAIGMMVARMFDGASAEDALAGAPKALLRPLQVFV